MTQPLSISGADYRIGDAIKGRWQIRNICGGKGHSGMGVVYIVDDILCETTLAAKTFQPHLVADKRVHLALEQEANSWLAMGTHQNIVTLNYVEVLGTQIYLFMDYIAPDENGRNCLTHYLSESALPEELTAKWALEICRALTHMRASGTHVHRDIKPDNVMIDVTQTVRVTDFGLAKAYTGSQDLPAGEQIPGVTVMGAIVGTPGYIAPEVIQGDPASVRSDIYAFGLVLMQMLSGKPWAPFTGVWNGDLMGYETGNLKIRETLITPASGSPFADVVAGCLAYDPNQRFVNFEEVERQLGALCNKRGISIPEPASAVGQVPPVSDSGIDQINALYNLGRLGEALDAVMALRRTDPDNAGLLTCEGTIRSDLGDNHNAIPLLERACDLSPDWCGTWNNLGKALRAAGRSEEALATFDKAVQVDDRYSMMWASRGNCLSDLGRFEEALVAYDRAINLDALDWAALLGRAKTLACLDRVLDAVGAVEKVFDVEPDDTDAQSLYDELIAKIAASQQTTFHQAITESNDLYRVRKFDEGLRIVRKARLQLGPSIDLWNNEGVFLTALADYRTALRCFERALRDEPERSDLWTNKGRVYRRLQRPHEALQCHEQATRIEPGDVLLWTNKYACLLDLDLVDQARECFRSACGHATSPEDRSLCREKEPDLYYLSMAEFAQSDARWADTHRYANSIATGSPHYHEAIPIVARSQYYLATERFAQDIEEQGAAFQQVIETLARAKENIGAQQEKSSVQQQLDSVCSEYLNRFYGTWVESDEHDRACALLALVINNATNEDLISWSRQQLAVWVLNSAIEKLKDSNTFRQQFIDRGMEIARG